MAQRRRVLLVDDEPQIQRFLKPSLTASSFDVLQAATGAEAVALFERERPDLVLLDLGLPDMNGKEVILAIRALSDAPIIVVSAWDQEIEKVSALDMGANDYVTKPFGIGELLARIRVVLRSRTMPDGNPERLHAPPITIELSARQVTVRGVVTRLTPKEFDVLVLFIRNQGRVLTHRAILTEVWGPAHVADTQYLRVLLGQLRRKIELDPIMPSLLTTETGIGYRFVPEDET